MKDEIKKNDTHIIKNAMMKEFRKTLQGRHLDIVEETIDRAIVDKDLHALETIAQHSELF